MDGKDGLILWTLGGAGVLLLYSAYANKSPRTVLASTLGTAPGAAPSPASGAAPVNRLAPGNGFDRPGAGFGGGVSGTFDTDASGTSYFFDADGNIAGVIPAPYENSAATFIPPGGTSFA